MHATTTTMPALVCWRPASAHHPPTASTTATNTTARALSVCIPAGMCCTAVNVLVSTCNKRPPNGLTAALAPIKAVVTVCAWRFVLVLALERTQQPAQGLGWRSRCALRVRLDCGCQLGIHCRSRGCSGSWLRLGRLCRLSSSCCRLRFLRLGCRLLGSCRCCWRCWCGGCGCRCSRRLRGCCRLGVTVGSCWVHSHAKVVAEGRQDGVLDTLGGSPGGHLHVGCGQVVARHLLLVLLLNVLLACVLVWWRIAARAGDGNGKLGATPLVL